MDLCQFTGNFIFFPLRFFFHPSETAVRSRCGCFVSWLPSLPCLFCSVNVRVLRLFSVFHPQRERVYCFSLLGVLTE